MSGEQMTEKLETTRTYMSSWTSAEDAKLAKARRSQGLSWAEVAVEVGRSAAACKERWKAVRGADYVPRNPKWTAEQDATLLRLHAMGATWQEIADATSRTIFAAVGRLKTIQQRATDAPKVGTSGIHSHERRAAIQRARQAQDEAIRAESYRSVTAYVCGDPLPGRSALDQRREGR